MKTLSGERLIAMIDSLGRINQTQFDEGTGAIATSFAYTWHSGTFEIEQQTVTPPAVPSGQSGSGASAARKEWFDGDDRLAWSMDELGRVTSRQYNPLTGRRAQRYQPGVVDLFAEDPVAADKP